VVLADYLNSQAGDDLPIASKADGPPRAPTVGEIHPRELRTSAQRDIDPAPGYRKIVVGSCRITAAVALHAAAKYLPVERPTDVPSRNLAAAGN